MTDFSEFKKFFMFNLIGSLVIVALIAVITVLTGSFGSQITWKVFSTLFMVTIHSLISLSFVWNDERQHTFENLSIFTNTIFILIICSFVSSIFGIWEILTLTTIWHIYLSIVIIGFAALHIDILTKAMNKEKYIDNIIYANFVMIVLVVILLLLRIFIENPETVLGDFVANRLLAALSIVDGTLSILTIIFYKLYMNKHPKEKDVLSADAQNASKEKKGLSVWVWILIAYLVLQVLSIFASFMFRLF